MKIKLEVAAIGSYGAGNNVVFHVKNQGTENKEERPLFHDEIQGSVTMVGIHPEVARKMKRGKTYTLILQEFNETKENDGP